MIVPTRQLELELLGRHRLVAGVDEVGRGALAGPVSVGVAVVSRATSDDFPPQLRDSKLLPPALREDLRAPVCDWLLGHAVGHASPGEIDAVGIIAALRLAAARAFTRLRGDGLAPEAVILDGKHNWLVPDLLDEEPLPEFAEVAMRIKGDATCAVVAAASVVAKVERDAIMTALADPGYDWANNKGYSSPAHQEALLTLGACELHRRSWNLRLEWAPHRGGMMVP